MMNCIKRIAINNVKFMLIIILPIIYLGGSIFASSGEEQQPQFESDEILEEEETQDLDRKASGEDVEDNPTVIKEEAGNALSPDALNAYHPDDVSVINRLIDNNGLGWTRNDPDSWGSGITWYEDENGLLRIVDLFLTQGTTVTPVSGEIDVTGLEYLERFYVHRQSSITKVTAKNIPKLYSLTAYSCSNLKYIDISGSCTDAEDRRGQNISGLQLQAHSNASLETIIVDGCTELTHLLAYDAALAGSLDVSSCIKLTNLEVDNWGDGGSPKGTSSLKKIDASGCTNLKEFYFNGNPLEYLYMSDCTSIKNLGSYQNTSSGMVTTEDWEFSDLEDMLKELDLSGCTWLKKVVWSGTIIEYLNVSGCTSLETMEFSSNTNLTTSNLDLSGCTSLKKLSCFNNKLTSVDLSGCTALEELSCYNNNIGSLDLSNCTKLQELNCYDNELGSLDMIGCTALTTLKCSNNSLGSLDLKDCTSLTTLECYENPLSYFGMENCTSLTTLVLINNNYYLPMETFIARDGSRLDITSDPEGEVWMTGYTHGSGAMTFRVDEIADAGFVDWKVNGLVNNTGNVDNKTISVTMQADTDATLHANFKIMKVIHYVYYSGESVEDVKINGQTISGGQADVLLADVEDYLETDNYTSVGYMLNAAETYGKDSLSYWGKTDVRSITDPDLENKDIVHVYIVLESFLITPAIVDTTSGNEEYFGYRIDRTSTAGAIAFNEAASNQAVSLGYDYTLQGSFSTNGRYVTVESGITDISIVLKDVSITHNAQAPFAVESDSSVKVLLLGKNFLTNSVTSVTGDYAPGLSVTGSGQLSIDVLTAGDTEASLTATGGYYSPGIGFPASSDGIIAHNGEISIYGGNITAKAGSYGTGIGTAYYAGFTGKIQIYGGDITAVGSSYAAGIGTGASGALSGSILIYDGNITATGGDRGSGIGTGQGGAFTGAIEIHEGVINAYGGGSGFGGAGIGTAYGSAWNNGGTLTIEGGTINAYGGGTAYAGAGIGTGVSGTFYAQGLIKINGGMVNAAGGSCEYAGAGIGLGAYYSLANSFYGSIQITEGTVIAAGGDGKYAGAGIGTGGYRFYLNGNISVSGGNVMATGGNGTNSGAGIGSGGTTYNNMSFASTVSVSGGEVTANGGSGTSSGAGIGSGAGANAAGTVNITAGTVSASGGAGSGAGIGNGGPLDEAQTIYTNNKVNISGQARVYAFSASGYYAIAAGTLSGSGQLINAYFTDGTTGPRDIEVYILENDGAETANASDTIELESGYSNFAFSIGSISSSDLVMETMENGEWAYIANGDAENANDYRGYGPYSAMYNTTDFRTISGSTLSSGITHVYPVMLKKENTAGMQLNFIYPDGELVYGTVLETEETGIYTLDETELLLSAYDYAGKSYEQYSIGWYIGEEYTRSELKQERIWDADETRSLDVELDGVSLVTVYIIVDPLLISPDTCEKFDNKEMMGYSIDGGTTGEVILNTVSGEMSGRGYLYTIQGTFGSDAGSGIHVVVEEDTKDLNLLLNQARIYQYAPYGITCSPLYLSEGSRVNLFLAGHNILENSATYSVYVEGGAPGINVYGSAELTIDTYSETDIGSLRAAGGRYGCGIGMMEESNWGSGKVPTKEFTGKIIINGGKVNAEGGGNASGIGKDSSTSLFGEQAQIIINGGEVTASGSIGIGTGGSSSYNNLEGKIIINDGIVQAYGSGGPGIGSGSEFTGEIIINGGNVTSISNSVGGAGLGTTSHSHFTGKIMINGGTVTAAAQSYGAGIGAGFRSLFDGDVEINGGNVTATSGGMRQDGEVSGSDGIGVGANDGDEMLVQPERGIGDNSRIYISKTAAVRAYGSSGYGFHAAEIAGDGQYVNAYFTDDTVGSLDIDITINNEVYTTVQLPDSYRAFAYTIESDAETDMMVSFEKSGDGYIVLNGDYKDKDNPDPAGYGPHSASYGSIVIRSKSAAKIPWPVTTVQASTVQMDIYYYYLDGDGEPQLFEETDLEGNKNPLIVSTMLGTSYEIDLTQWGSLPYEAWYYTLGNDSEAEPVYFADAGSSVSVSQSGMEIHVYAVSTQIDVSVPADSFFWYANEDTQTQLDYILNTVTGEMEAVELLPETGYEIRSAAYEIKNHGLTDLNITLAGYEEKDTLNEIGQLLEQNTQDALILNLTGDLSEGKLGRDLLKQANDADPFGTYSSGLGSGQSWRYSFSGFYQPASGKLPENSATSYYKLVFGFEVKLGKPETITGQEETP